MGLLAVVSLLVICAVSAQAYVLPRPHPKPWLPPPYLPHPFPQYPSPDGMGGLRVRRSTDDVAPQEELFYVDVINQVEAFEVPKDDLTDHVTALMDAKRGVAVYKDITQEVCMISRLDDNILPTGAQQAKHFKVKVLSQEEEEAYLSAAKEAGQRPVLMTSTGAQVENLAEVAGQMAADMCGGYPVYELVPEGPHRTRRIVPILVRGAVALGRSRAFRAAVIAGATLLLTGDTGRN
ncbi:uncharacterized protein [Branchiostoma lanceolatum]|uniref:uncharacterized protein n=1 Tax=Branchiostoma lanceolatum TaxID=7740 RepID=UPI0034515A16